MKGEKYLMNRYLKSFLESEAERLSETMKQFEGTILVCERRYEKEIRDKGNGNFYGAKNAMEGWLGEVILSEIMETGAGAAKIELNYPEESLELSAGADKSFKSFGSFGGDTSERIRQNRILTPIGSLTPYVYEAVIEIKGNPVELFYRHISKQTGILHDKCGSGVLTLELLRKHNMCDVIGIYKMDLLLRDIDKFFDGK